jgi:hypothetical protein
MTQIEIKQKNPSEVYDDWQKTIETLKIVPLNVATNTSGKLPSWTLNLNSTQISEITDDIVKENNLHYTLGLISSIEGLFNHQVKSFVSRKRKNKLAKSVRKKFKKLIQDKKQIRFDDILDIWKKYDPIAKSQISSLKSILQYRNWLAHGRHWKIHYWKCPDPNDVYLLYSELCQVIDFDLSF